jgi:hypothetical protein|tara:strand:+ start:2079 stop:2504 length:426 start_codon:yes stop_codon:yes gene_type:complete
MQKPFHLMIVVILFLSGLIAQNDIELEKYGFIDIRTDSMNVPFFIDGFYVGNHPLKSPVPVLPGFHEVSYIPPDIQDEKIRENLTEGIKRVYVAENDTLDVFLFYDHYLAQVETLHQEIKIQSYVGFSLFLVLVYVVLSVL